MTVQSQWDAALARLAARGTEMVVVLALLLVAASHGDSAGAESLAGRPCTIAAFGDTQGLVNDWPKENNPAFIAAVDWILANRAAHGIELVLHPGDVVNGSQYAYQWESFLRQWDRLKDAGIPQVVAIGNHDWGPWKGGQPSSDAFVERLGPAYYSGLPYDGQHHPLKPEEGYIEAEVCGVTMRVYRLASYRNPRDADYRWVQRGLEEAAVPSIVLRHWNEGQLRRWFSRYPHAFLWVSGHRTSWVHINASLDGVDPDVPNPSWVPRRDFDDVEPQVIELQHNHQMQGDCRDGAVALIRLSPGARRVEILTYQAHANRSDLAPTMARRPYSFPGWPRAEGARTVNEPPAWSTLRAGKRPDPCTDHDLPD